jgi:hypothetical protein
LQYEEPEAYQHCGDQVGGIVPDELPDFGTLRVKRIKLELIAIGIMYIVKERKRAEDGGSGECVMRCTKMKW